jgi:hypothetical protein
MATPPKDSRKVLEGIFGECISQIDVMIFLVLAISNQEQF